MVSTSQFRGVLVVVIVVGMLSAIGPATTYSQFVDEEASTGTVTASSQGSGNGPCSGGPPCGGPGNGDPGPEGSNAYDDKNQNGKFDENDEVVGGDQLANYNDQDVDLVIPSDVTGVEPQNGQVSITAASIDSQANITSNTNQVSLRAETGNVEVPGTSVTGNQLNITANNGEVMLDDATVTGNSGSISVEARSISAESAVFESGGQIELATQSGGDGDVDVSGLQASSTGTFAIDVTGDVSLADGTLSSGEQVDITSDGDFDASNLQATSTGTFAVDASGDASMNDASINPGGQVDITSNGQVNISSTTVDASTGAISVSSESIDASNTFLSSTNNGISLRANQGQTGTIEATGVDVETTNAQIRFISIDGITLDDGNLQTQNSGIIANLGTDSASLSIDRASIVDKDDELTYTPANITVTGTPSSGSASS